MLKRKKMFTILTIVALFQENPGVFADRVAQRFYAFFLSSTCTTSLVT